MPIFGADLSDFDRGRGPVDVAAMARDGITFLTHKATEGTRVQHGYYGATLNAARAAGIPFLGAYVVPRTPGNNGHGSVRAQADYLLAYLDAQTPWWRSDPTFFLQVDTEHWGYDDVSGGVGAGLCSTLRSLTGKWVVHYAPRWAYGDSIPGTDPLWASAYGNNPAVPYRQAYRGDNDPGWAPYSGRTPVFLQYGSKVTIGSQPGCDINAYRGTLDQLRTLIMGGHDVEQTEQLKGYAARPGRTVGDVLSDLSNLRDWLYGTPGQNGANPPPAGSRAALLVQSATAISGGIQLTDAQAATMADKLAGVLVARQDNPLGDADRPAIVAAVKQALREGVGEPS